MELKKGTELQGGKYRIVRFISSGGFGCTYEAEHVLLEERVAIKEFFVGDFCNRDETSGHVTVATQKKQGLIAKLRRKFIEEARSLRRLQHPGIVSVSDVFEENGTAYFVMDYVDGKSLSEIVRENGPLSEERALRYIRQVAEALQYVHDNNRLHLDIKPGNIMIDGNDRPVLIDFGASKQYDEESGENTSTLLGKTPGYAPLEQMGNDVMMFTPATDIYALGATFYKLLTGVTPLTATLLASGETLAPLPAGVSASTRNAIAAAMAINKSKRPQSLRDFLQLLDNGTCETVYGEGEETILDSEPAKPVRPEKPVQKTPSPEKNGQKGKKKFPLWILAVAAGVISVVVLLSVSRSSGKPVAIPEIEMVYVEGGTFMMGATSESEVVYGEDPHSVTLSDYYIGKYEVTQSQWKAVMGSNPSKRKGADLPVENVSWNDVQEFIRRLNAKTDKEYRLPTEEEWEYAARGGNKSQGYRYSGSDDVDTVAWYKDNSGRKTHPVGTKAANELGIHDMSGNVWEWCSDGETWYYADPQPGLPPSGIDYVLRGGSWYRPEVCCLVFHRDKSGPEDHSAYTGFRLASSSL